MARNCFAPGCDSGYPSAIARNKALGKKNPSLFCAPKEAELLEKWQRYIPRKDKIFAPPSKLCELHFDEACISKNYEKVLADGSVFVYERGRPTLKPGSIPTKFPNLPKYFSSETPKRKVPASRNKRKRESTESLLNPIHELVRVIKQDKLHLIAINRPEKRNCVNPETASQLKTAFQNFEDDSNALVAILHGMGGTFSAGLDLKEVAAANTYYLTVADGPMGPTKMALKKPVIAAVDGYAVAGGFELALWCDLRVVEETAIMGIFNRRFGVPLTDGGTVRLPGIVGLGRALDLILTGRGINGKEANDMGLVTKLCKKGQALETAISLANELCKFPQNCMNADRLSAYNATYSTGTIDESLKYELEHALPVLVDAVKGAEQFVKGVGRHGKNLEKPILPEEGNRSKL